MFNKDRKTKAIERIFPPKKEKKSLVKKAAVVMAAIMGIGAAIAQAAKGGDQQ